MTGRWVQVGPGRSVWRPEPPGGWIGPDALDPYVGPARVAAVRQGQDLWTRMGAAVQRAQRDAVDVDVQMLVRRVPRAFELSKAAAAAGLVVLKMGPTRCGCEHFEFVLFAGDGTLWADGTGESAEEVLEHIARYRRRAGVE